MGILNLKTHVLSSVLMVNTKININVLIVIVIVILVLKINVHHVMMDIV